MAGICVLRSFLLLLLLLPGEDIRVLTVSWRKLWAQCLLRARVRQRESASERACESVRGCATC